MKRYAFSMTVLLLAAVTVLAGVKFFPAVLAHIHNNGEICEMVKHPDTVFHDFSRCRREVEDASYCYNTRTAQPYRLQNQKTVRLRAL